jgi:uncharacterized membrane protein YciS (DUF1049 family)
MPDLEWLTDVDPDDERARGESYRLTREMEWRIAPAAAVMILVGAACGAVGRFTAIRVRAFVSRATRRLTRPTAKVPVPEVTAVVNDGPLASSSEVA